MKAEHVELLRELLPEWEFADRGGLVFRTPAITGFESIVRVHALDHLTAEVERALLKDERVCWVRTFVYGDGSAQVDIWSGFDGTPGSKVLAPRIGESKLDALLEAYRQVQA